MQKTIMKKNYPKRLIYLKVNMIESQIMKMKNMFIKTILAKKKVHFKKMRNIKLKIEVTIFIKRI